MMEPFEQILFATLRSSSLRARRSHVGWVKKEERLVGKRGGVVIRWSSEGGREKEKGEIQIWKRRGRRRRNRQTGLFKRGALVRLLQGGEWEWEKMNLKDLSLFLYIRTGMASSLEDDSAAAAALRRINIWLLVLFHRRQYRIVLRLLRSLFIHLTFGWKKGQSPSLISFAFFPSCLPSFLPFLLPTRVSHEELENLLTFFRMADVPFSLPSCRPHIFFKPNQNLGTSRASLDWKKGERDLPHSLLTLLLHCCPEVVCFLSTRSSSSSSSSSSAAVAVLKPRPWDSKHFSFQFFEGGRVEQCLGDGWIPRFLNAAPSSSS